jgi:hypothetical protein
LFLSFDSKKLQVVPPRLDLSLNLDTHVRHRIGHAVELNNMGQMKYKLDMKASILR